MPNWCDNTLTVTGPDADLHDFIENNSLNEEGNLSPFLFNQSVPIPEESEDNWYNWCIENWGTKWEAEAYRLEPETPEELTAWQQWAEAQISSDRRKLAQIRGEEYESMVVIERKPVLSDFWRIRDNEVSINFLTAWGPAVTWLEKTSAKYPTLDFVMTYEEPGMGFQGTASGSCGEIFDETEDFVPDDEENDDDE